MKKLYFEGAGWDGAAKDYNGINPRIRTAFTNDLGHKVYLEILAGKRQKYMKGDPKYAAIPPLYMAVDFCQYITEDSKVQRCTGYPLVNAKGEPLDRNMDRTRPYTLKAILKFVNEECHCSFDAVEVLPDLAGYRVHRDTSKSGTAQGYNFGDEFQYDPVSTRQMEKKVEELTAYYKSLFHQRYDNTSYWREGNDLHVRLNVSVIELEKAGITNREYVIHF